MLIELSHGLSNTAYSALAATLSSAGMAQATKSMRCSAGLEGFVRREVQQGEQRSIDDGLQEEQEEAEEEEEEEEKVVKARFSGLAGFPSYSRMTLGVDYGKRRTGVAVSCGFAPRPVEVVELIGKPLIDKVLDFAEQENARDILVGCPLSTQTKQASMYRTTGIKSNNTSKPSSMSRVNPQAKESILFAKRLCNAAAKRGVDVRVMLYDESFTSKDALEHMIEFGSNRRSRREQLDAVAAAVLLRNYFDADGVGARLVSPKLNKRAATDA
eukprot:jgi/Chlat1/3054/Chrsp208S03299